MKLNTDQLKYLREKHGYTQEYMALKAGYTDKGAYCLLETGKRQPSLSKLGKIAVLFGVSVSDLLIAE